MNEALRSPFNVEDREFYETVEEIAVAFGRGDLTKTEAQGEQLHFRIGSYRVRAMVSEITQGLATLDECIEFVKAQPGIQYRDLYARKLVDIAVYLIIASLLADQATVSEKKLAVAKYWLSWRMPEIRMFKEQICSGEDAVVHDFEVLAGPVPVLD
ncbi:hypothetical protein LCGC14_2722380 [marine sediment metagenome]|uniref:Uncharacterized protein n=1 Tax=marine sediment metagenome TaxID=412755 RepID=A0A0F9BIV9_9ZZZZ